MGTLNERLKRLSPLLLLLLLLLQSTMHLEDRMPIHRLIRPVHVLRRVSNGRNAIRVVHALAQLMGQIVTPHEPIHRLVRPTQFDSSYTARVGRVSSDSRSLSSDNREVDKVALEIKPLRLYRLAKAFDGGIMEGKMGISDAAKLDSSTVWKAIS
jgi:hypothetical protein